MPAVAVAPAPRYFRPDGKSWNPFSPAARATGRPAQDNRRFINAVFWILRTDLPPDYGDHLLPLAGSVLEAVSLIDADPATSRPIPTAPGPGLLATSHCPHKRGLNSKLHLGGLPRNAGKATAGTVADCSQALPL